MIFRTLFVIVLLAGPAMAQRVIECEHARAVDGDTVACSDGLRIRLDGIDAPESRQPYGRQATTLLRSMLATGLLTCELRGSDRYGRLIGRCGTAAIPDVNRELVRQGVAWDYLAYSRGRFAEEERAARADRRGLWTAPHPTPPWDWRKAHRGQ
jgi:endonuclease YncB( thermonuclease family)